MSKLLLLMVACGVAMFGCSNDSEPKEVQQVEETEEKGFLDSLLGEEEPLIAYTVVDEKEHIYQYNGTIQEFAVEFEKVVNSNSDKFVLTGEVTHANFIDLGIFPRTTTGEKTLLDKDGNVIFKGSRVNYEEDNLSQYLSEELLHKDCEENHVCHNW